MFASDLDAASRNQLDRGARLTELLRQGQYQPYPVEDQVVSVWAGINGHLDDVPVDDILRFEQEFLEHLRHNSSALSVIAETKLFDDDTQAEVVSQLSAFKKTFHTSEGRLLLGHEEHEPIDESQVSQAQIVRRKRS